MFRLIVLNALVSVAFGAIFESGMVPMLDGLIVGGQPTTIEQFPHQISMLNFGSHRCGGAIVTSTKILTAAHCTRGTAQQNVAVRAGSTNHNTGGVVAPITGYVEHPQYNIPEELNNDIAVMFVAGLTFGSGIQPATLPAQGATVTPGTLGPVSGWGSLVQGGPCCPTVLQFVDLPYVTNAQCAAAYASAGYTISDDMLCAGFLGEGGRDACQGDSGGPLLFNGVHHGVVSWGIGCAQPNYPGVYARTAYFRNWIDAQ